MTTSGNPSKPDEVDQWLDRELSRLHGHLGAILDDRPVPEQHRAFASADLDDRFGTVHPAPSPATVIQAQTDRIAAMPPEQRLAIQSALPLRELRAVSDVGRLVTDAALIAEVLTACESDLRDVRRHLLDLDHALNAVADLTLGHARGLAHDLAVAPDLTAARRLIAPLLDELEQALDLDLAHAVTTLLAHELTRPLAHALAHGLVSHRDHATNRELATAVARLTAAATDFTDADLGAAALHGVRLRGVRWSSTTSWPPGLRQTIHDASRVLGNGTFEITGDPRSSVDCFDAATP